MSVRVSVSPSLQFTRLDADLIRLPRLSVCLCQVFFHTRPSRACQEWDLADAAYDMTAEQAKSHASRLRNLLPALTDIERVNLSREGDSLPVGRLHLHEAVRGDLLLQNIGRGRDSSDEEPSDAITN